MCKVALGGIGNVDNLYRRKKMMNETVSKKTANLSIVCHLSRIACSFLTLENLISLQKPGNDICL